MSAVSLRASTDVSALDSPSIGSLDILYDLSRKIPDKQPLLRHIVHVNEWISNYIKAQQAAHASIPVDQVANLIRMLTDALKEDRQVFVFGNGGSAANASHFATDLGKGASDKVGRRFRVISLNDNVSWMTALANDYAYDQIFVAQLQNYARAGDIAISLSVSGNSPNCVKALEWAAANGLRTVALVGAKRGRMAEVAEQALVINDVHYGRVEDAQMGICHMLCYAFMENPGWAKNSRELSTASSV